MPEILKGLYPPSAQGKRNAWPAALRTAQSVFLQYHDDGDPRCARCGRVCRVQEAQAGRYGRKYGLNERV